METQLSPFSKKQIKSSFSKIRDSLLDPEVIVAIRQFRGQMATFKEETIISDLVDGIIGTDLKFSPKSFKNGEMKFSFEPIRDEEKGTVSVRKKYTISVCPQDLLTEEELKKIFILGLSDVLENSLSGTVRKGETWKSISEFLQSKFKEDK